MASVLQRGGRWKGGMGSGWGAGGCGRGVLRRPITEQKQSSGEELTDG